MNCCKKNCKESCYSLDIQEIQDLLYGIDKQMYIETCKESDYINYGYGECPEEDSKTSAIQEILQDYVKREASGEEQCLSPEELSCLVQDLQKECDGHFTRLVVDESGKEEWASINNNCVSFEDWEKASFIFCKNIELDIVAEKSCAMDLDIEFTSEDAINFHLSVERGFITKELLVEIQEHCSGDNFLEIELDTRDCKAELELIHDTINPSLDLKLYKELTECGVSLELIKETYARKAELQIKNGTVYYKNDLFVCKLDALKTSSDLRNIKK